MAVLHEPPLVEPVVLVEVVLVVVVVEPPLVEPDVLVDVVVVVEPPLVEPVVLVEVVPDPPLVDPDVVCPRRIWDRSNMDTRATQRHCQRIFKTDLL